MTKTQHIQFALAWVTFVALCYGMLGPLLDHHFPERRATLRSQYPMLALMVGYTMVSLWIIAQPIVSEVR